MSDSVLPQGKTYEEVCARFRWSVPPTFNIAVAICDRHAGDPARLAMIYEDEAGRVSEHTFAEFRARSNQLARAFQRLGVNRGNRVGLVLSQCPELAVVHLAAYKLGAIVLPLATLFGPEALEYRLRDAGVRVAVTGADSLDRVLGVRKALARVSLTSSASSPADAEGVLDYRQLSRRRARQLRPRGDGGGGSGVVDLHLRHHRAAEGRAACAPDRHRPPAVDGDGPRVLPQAGRPVWTPADWAWAGTSRHAASRLAPRRARRGASVPEIRRRPAPSI